MYDRTSNLIKTPFLNYKCFILKLYEHLKIVLNIPVEKTIHLFDRCNQNNFVFQIILKHYNEMRRFSINLS